MKMRNGLAALALAAALAGCDGAAKKDLADLEQRLDGKLGQAEARTAQTAAELDRKITAIDAKFAGVLAIDQQVKNAVADMEGNAKQLARTNDVLRRLLEAQRASLKEQLTAVEEQLEVLKAK